MSPINGEVYIACPVCYSGNCFRLGAAVGDFACEDCGFELARDSGPSGSGSEECIFCGGRHFYFEGLLDLTFLGRATICYVCEARYKRAVVGQPDEKYNEEGAGRARRSWAASRWDDRAKGYNSPDGG